MAYATSKRISPEIEMEGQIPDLISEKTMNTVTLNAGDIMTPFHDMQPHPEIGNPLRRYMRPIRSSAPGSNHTKDITSVCILECPLEDLPSSSTTTTNNGTKLILITGSVDGSAKLWDLLSGALLKNLQGHGKAADNRNLKVLSVSACNFNHSSLQDSLIATGSEDTTAIVWRLDGSQLCHLNNFSDAKDKIHKEPISCVALLNLSTPVIAMSSHDKTCSIWSLLCEGERQTVPYKGNCLYKFNGKVHTDLINHMTFFTTSFHLEDLTIITAGWDKTVGIWRLKNSMRPDSDSLPVVQADETRLVGHKKSVTAITAHMVSIRDSDSQCRRYPVVVTASLDKTAIVWDMQTAEQISVLEGHTGKLNAVIVINKDEYHCLPTVVTASDDKTIIIWDMMTAQPIRTFLSSNRVLALSALPSEYGPLIVSGGADMIATVWDLRASQRIRKLYTGAVTGIGTYESKTTAIVNGGTKEVTETKVVIGDVLNHSTVFDLETGDLIETIESHSKRLNFLATYSPKKNPSRAAFITCAHDATAKVWDFHTLKLRALFNKHDQLVFALAVYDPELCHEDCIKGIPELSAPLVITGGLDKDIRFWDLSVDGNPADSKYIIKQAHAGFVRAMAVYHPVVASDVPLLVSGSYDLSAKIWDLRTKKLLRVLRGHTDYVFLISIYDPIKHVGGEAEAEKLDRTSPLAITGSYDNTVKVWDMRSGHVLNTLKGHKDSVTAMDLFVPKDPTAPPLLVTGSIDTLVIVWDVLKGQPLQTLVGHTDRVCFICIHYPREGNPLILSGSDDKSTIIWEDALYPTSHMPLRDSANRMFFSDITNEDWPLITSFTLRYGSSFFMEHSNLFFLAIEQERADFLLKFRKYLSLCLRHMKRYDVEVDKESENGKEVQSMSLLDFALFKSDLISVKAILLCWIENLNTDVYNLLTQNVFHACHFFPELKDLLPLSKKYPLEYVQFIAAIRLVRNHYSLLGNVKEKRLDQLDRYEVTGTHDQQAGFEEVWGAHFKKEGFYERLILIFSTIFSRNPPEPQPITSLFIPIRSCANLRNGFGAFIDVCDQLNSVALFDSPIGIYSVQYFWLNYTRVEHIKGLLIYLAVHVFFMLFVYSYQFYYDPGKHVGTDIAMNVYMAVVVLTFFYYIYEEYMQMLSIKSHRGKEQLSSSKSGEHIKSGPTKMSWVGALSHFGRDLWNVVDLIICISGVTGILVVAGTGKFGTIGRCFLSACSVLMWFKILYYLRPFSSSGPLAFDLIVLDVVVMILKIAFEIRYFIVVLFCVLCGFAQAFWLLSSFDDSLTFGTVQQSLLNCFMYMLGQNVDPSAFDNTVAPEFAIVLLIIFLIFMMILMLNLLIALMGDTFSIVRAQGQALWRKEQASIIFEECFMLNAEIETHKYVHVLRYTADLQMDDSEKKDMIEKSVNDCAVHVKWFTPLSD